MQQEEEARLRVERRHFLVQASAASLALLAPPSYLQKYLGSIAERSPERYAGGSGPDFPHLPQEVLVISRDWQFKGMLRGMTLRHDPLHAGVDESGFEVLLPGTHSADLDIALTGPPYYKRRVKTHEGEFEIEDEESPVRAVGRRVRGLLGR
jgi:hypothetical protein